MKKFALPLVFAFSLIAALFTGCNDTLVAPEDTWCRLDKEVAGQELNFYLYYTTDEDKIEYKTGKTLVCEPGLTVVVSKDVDLGVVDTTAWTYKTFKLEEDTELDEEADTDDGSTKNKMTFKGTFWDAIYLNYYKSDFKEHSSTSVPSVVKSGTNVSSLQDLTSSTTEKLSWKKVAKSLLSKMLDD